MTLKESLLILLSCKRNGTKFPLILVLKRVVIPFVDQVLGHDMTPYSL